MTTHQTTYFIQSLQNQSYCIGVKQATRGQPVVLSYLDPGNPLSQWYMDTTTGLIRLAADPSLFLDVQGTTVQSSSPLIIHSYVPGRLTQLWNWIVNPPFIVSRANPTLVVSNTYGSIAPGNPIQLYAQTTATWQQWTELPAVDLQAFAAQQKSEGAVAPFAIAGGHEPTVA